MARYGRTVAAVASPGMETWATRPPDGDGRDGILDEALERLHRSGPERAGWLSNHAPMAVEAMVRSGRSPLVHRWLDRYRHKLEEPYARRAAVTDANWREALGDPGRLTDWTDYFSRQLAERPWRQVLAAWWPLLLPGIAGAATHPVIRVGHAVRTLLDAEDAGGGAAGESGTAGAADAAGAEGPRRAELAHALGYWAGRHQPLTVRTGPVAAGTTAAALAAVEPVDGQHGGIRERFARLAALPGCPGPAEPSPGQAQERLAELVRAATYRYATHGHGAPVMLVHTATAPNAVLRTLPALPRALWAPSLQAAWSAVAAVTAAYAPADAGTDPDPAPAPPPGTATAPASAAELFGRAAAHGDEHAVKLADTALDVAYRDGRADGPASAAVLRALELIDPAW